MHGARKAFRVGFGGFRLLDFRVQGLGFRLEAFGFRVWGLGL